MKEGWICQRMDGLISVVGKQKKKRNASRWVIFKKNEKISLEQFLFNDTHSVRFLKKWQFVLNIIKT